MRESNAWGSPIIDIERIDASLEDHGFCPVDTPFKRIVTSQLLVFSQCFANLNRKASQTVIGSTDDPTDAVIKKIQKAHSPGYDPTKLSEWALHNRIGFYFSNNVDPFMPDSEVQFRLGERILRTLLEYRQPAFVMTKEVYTPNVRDLLIEGKDIFSLYVSISTIDNATAKRFETITPTPAERLRRVEDLAKHGVKVCVALNPYVPAWQPDLHAYFAAVRDAGAVGVYVDPLHITEKQRSVAPERLGQWRDNKDFTNRYIDFLNEEVPLLEAMAKYYGLKLHHMGRSDDDFYGGNALGIKIWPFDPHHFVKQVLEPAYNDEGKVLPVLVRWKDVDEFYAKKDPAWNQVFRFDEFGDVLYLCGARDIARRDLGTKNTMRNIHRWIFNNFWQMSRDIYFHYYCHPLGDTVDGNEEGDFCTDDNGDVCYIFDPEMDINGDFVDQADPDFPGYIELE